MRHPDGLVLPVRLGNPDVVHLTAVASMTSSYCMPDDFGWDRPVVLQPWEPDPTLCSHCQQEPKSPRHRGTHLGAWCLDTQRRNDGELPTAEQIERRVRKLYRDQQEEDGHDPDTRYSEVSEILMPVEWVSYYGERVKHRRTGPLIPGDTLDLDEWNR